MTQKNKQCVNPLEEVKSQNRAIGWYLLPSNFLGSGGVEDCLTDYFRIGSREVLEVECGGWANSVTVDDRTGLCTSDTATMLTFVSDAATMLTFVSILLQL